MGERGGCDELNGPNFLLYGQALQDALQEELLMAQRQAEHERAAGQAQLQVPIRQPLRYPYMYFGCERTVRSSSNTLPPVISRRFHDKKCPTSLQDFFCNRSVFSEFFVVIEKKCCYFEVEKRVVWYRDKG